MNFIKHHRLIRYNQKTREIVIKNWGKDNFHKAGKPVMDCILSELKEVEDPSLIQYVADSIQKREIRSMYESFCQQEEMFLDMDETVQGENANILTESEDVVDKLSDCQMLDGQDESDVDITEPEEVDDTNTRCWAISRQIGNRADIDKDVSENEANDDTLSRRFTIRGQKEKQKQKEKQQAVYPDVVIDPQNSLRTGPDMKEMIEFWDSNGLGATYIYGKV